MITMYRCLAGLALFAAGFATSVAQSNAPVPLPQGVSFVTTVEGINEYRLPNGLRVLLFTDPTKDNVTVNITYLVGSRNEHYGETGMAHLLEHLMFKGSTNHPDVPKELKDHGSRPNGTTSMDRTNYFETFRATDENLKWALELEADRMVNSFIAKKDLESEMTVVRNEHEAGENNPQGVLVARVASTAFLWHNYGKSTIGARSDLERVPIERLQAFYRHFYQPDNAVLVIAGKFDEAKALALVNTTFGPISRPDRALRTTYTSEPVQDGERTVTLRRAGDVQAVCIAHHVPAGSDPDYAAIQVASAILGEIPSGRLHKALVETGKAVSASTYAQQFKDPGLLYMMAAVRTEKSLENAEAAIIATIDGLKSRPFTEDELKRTKAQFEKSLELMLNNSESVALSLSNWQAQGDWRLLFLHRDRIRKLTTKDVQNAALKYLVSSNRTIGRFIPDKAPERAEIPDTPDVAAMLKDFKSESTIVKGEAFEATNENIDRLTQNIDLPGGLRLSLLPKKTRGAQVQLAMTLHFGDEKSLVPYRVSGPAAGAMLMRGTTRHTRAEIKDTFDQLKANVAVSGGLSSASARVTVNRDNLKRVLALVAEILREPAFPEAEFEQMRQAQLASIENMRSDPQAIASLAMERTMKPYPKGDVRYVPSIDEQLELIRGMKLEEVKAFHAAFYGASVGEVAVIGDFDPAEVQAQLTELFGSWKSPRPYARIVQEHHAIDARGFTFETPDKANAVWIGALNFRMTDLDPDFPAFALASYMIGSGMNSRLFARIRGKEGLSYSVSSTMPVPKKDDSSAFIARAICAPQNAPKVEAAFKDEMTQILEKGFSDAEVEAAKKSWLQSRVLIRADDAQMVAKLATNRFWGYNMAREEAVEQKLAKLTPAEIQAALRRHIDISAMSYFRAGDFKKANVIWPDASLP